MPIHFDHPVKQEVWTTLRALNDTAIVTCYYDMSFDMSGRRIDLGGSDLFVFVRENGRWWAVADQFSPYPA